MEKILRVEMSRTEKVRPGRWRLKPLKRAASGGMITRIRKAKFKAVRSTIVKAQVLFRPLKMQRKLFSDFRVEQFSVRDD
jgi:hypothetical protein